MHQVPGVGKKVDQFSEIVNEYSPVNICKLLSLIGLQLALIVAWGDFSPPLT